MKLGEAKEVRCWNGATLRDGSTEIKQRQVASKFDGLVCRYMPQSTGDVRPRAERPRKVKVDKVEVVKDEIEAMDIRHDGFLLLDNSSLKKERSGPTENAETVLKIGGEKQFSRDKEGLEGFDRDHEA